MNIHVFVLLVNVFTAYGCDSSRTDAVKKYIQKYDQLSGLYQEILHVMEGPNEQILIDENETVKEIQTTVETATLTKTEEPSSNTAITPINCSHHQNGLDSAGLENGMARLEQSMRMVYRGISAEKSARIKNTQSIIRLEGNVTEVLNDLMDETVIIHKRLTELSEKCANIAQLDKKIQKVNDKLDGSNLSMKTLTDKVENVAELDKKIQQANDKLDRSNLRMVTMSDKLDTLYTAMRMIILNANVNVALNKPATQSSTHEIHANAATDGNKDGHWDSHSCTHTQTQDNPWWRVDLEDQFLINKVVIKNRQDCCGERLHDFTLTVSKTKYGQQVLCGHYNGHSTNGAIETIRCSPNVMGRFLKIQIKGTSAALTLCEVEVY